MRLVESCPASSQSSTLAYHEEHVAETLEAKNKQLSEQLAQARNHVSLLEKQCLALDAKVSSLELHLQAQQQRFATDLGDCAAEHNAVSAQRDLLAVALAAEEEKAESFKVQVAARVAGLESANAAMQARLDLQIEHIMDTRAKDAECAVLARAGKLREKRISAACSAFLEAMRELDAFLCFTTPECKVHNETGVCGVELSCFSIQKLQHGAEECCWRASSCEKRERSKESLGSWQVHQRHPAILGKEEDRPPRCEESAEQGSNPPHTVENFMEPQEGIGITPQGDARSSMAAPEEPPPSSPHQNSGRLCCLARALYCSCRRRQRWHFILQAISLHSLQRVRHGAAARRRAAALACGSLRCWRAWAAARTRRWRLVRRAQARHLRRCFSRWLHRLDHRASGSCCETHCLRQVFGRWGSSTGVGHRGTLADPAAVDPPAGGSPVRAGPGRSRGAVEPAPGGSGREPPATAQAAESESVQGGIGYEQPAMGRKGSVCGGSLAVPDLGRADPSLSESVTVQGVGGGACDSMCGSWVAAMLKEMEQLREDIGCLTAAHGDFRFREDTGCLWEDSDVASEDTGGDSGPYRLAACASKAHGDPSSLLCGPGAQ